NSLLVQSKVSVADVNYKVGLQYSLELPNSSFTLGATFQPEVILSAADEYNLITATELLEGDITSTATALPANYEIGLGIQSEKWLLGIDGTFERWDNLNRLLDRSASYRYENVYGLSVGAQYTVLKYKRDSPVTGTLFRAGFGLRNSYLNIDDDNFLVWQYTLGIGLPVGRSKDRINFTYKFQQQGRLDNNLVRESTHNLSIALDFRDIWFKKKRIN
ncbi:MAG: hypothetical protein AAFO07_32425, partial [Bacteroidota bacterium]